jgi:hypothetical protein
MAKYHRVKLSKAKMFKCKLGNLSDTKKLGRVFLARLIPEYKL